MIFFPGVFRPAQAGKHPRCMISARTLAKRSSGFPVADWILDSGGFTELYIHGGYRESVAAYASMIERFSDCGNLLAAVAQDYMCEPAILERTGLTSIEHRRLTIERYDELRARVGSVYIMPVIQGYAAHEYAEHIAAYGNRIAAGAWIGVGSLVKRSSSPGRIAGILSAILECRPDVQLHGFGIKLTSLKDARVRGMLTSSDSMAWSLSARYSGGDGNDWREAEKYAERVRIVAAGERQIPLARA